MSDEDYGFEPIQEEDDNHGFEPSEEDQAKIIDYLKNKSVSGPESFLRGSEQGLTLGGADELGSAIGATTEILGGNDSMDRARGFLKNPMAQDTFDAEFKKPSLDELYQEYLKFNRQRYDEAEAANPKTFMGGEFAGGALIPVGGSAKAGTAAGAKGMLALAKQGLSNAKPLIKQGAKIGAGVGLVAGANSSDAPLLSGEFARDTITGGVLGSGVGAAAPIALPAIAAAANKTGELLAPIGNGIMGGLIEPIIGPETMNAFRFGKQGDFLASKEGQKNVAREMTQVGHGLNDDLAANGAKLAAAQHRLEQIAEHSWDKTVNIQDELMKVLDEVNAVKAFDPTVQVEKDRVIKTVENIWKQTSSGKGLSPADAKSAQNALSKMQAFGPNALQDSDLLRAVNGGKDGVRTAIRKEIPLMGTIDKKIAANRNAQEIMSLPDPKKFTNMSDDLKAAQKIAAVIGKIEQEKLSGAAAEDKLLTFLRELRITNPELAAKYEPKLTSMAKKYNTAQELSRDIYLPRPMASAHTIAGRAANVAGYGVGKLQRLAEKMGAAGSSQATIELGRILAGAATKEERARNAIIFNLLQNPGYKHLMEKYDDDPTDTQEPVK